MGAAAGPGCLGLQPSAGEGGRHSSLCFMQGNGNQPGWRSRLSHVAAGRDAGAGAAGWALWMGEFALCVVPSGDGVAPHRARGGARAPRLAPKVLTHAAAGWGRRGAGKLSRGVSAEPPSLPAWGAAMAAAVGERHRAPPAAARASRGGLSLLLAMAPGLQREFLFLIVLQKVSAFPGGAAAQPWLTPSPSLSAPCPLTPQGPRSRNPPAWETIRLSRGDYWQQTAHKHS